MAVLFLELWEVVEVGEEADVEAFHCDACADKDAPPNGFRVELHALNQGHSMLFVGGGFGTSDQNTIRAPSFRRVWVVLFFCGHLQRMPGRQTWNSGEVEERIGV